LFAACQDNVELCKEKADKRFKGSPLFYYITYIIGSGLVSSFLLEKGAAKKPPINFPHAHNSHEQIFCCAPLFIPPPPVPPPPRTPRLTPRASSTPLRAQKTCARPSARHLKARQCHRKLIYSVS
jgi:hypothetical protein